MGAAAVLAQSFARIHEANLKKQAELTLMFDNQGDRDLIGVDARIGGHRFTLDRTRRARPAARPPRRQRHVGHL